MPHKRPKQAIRRSQARELLRKETGRKGPARLKKGSKEAKQRMAELREMRKK